MSAPTAARRVTPTAVRILSADAGRSEWLARRRAGIGSSDVAAIVGATDRSTPLHVYLDKHGELPDQQNEAMLWGSLNEDTVAREWARRNASVIRRVGLVAHEREPWMLATLDRQILECPLRRQEKLQTSLGTAVEFEPGEREACALEVKCRSAFLASKWKRDVPDDVLAQTTWQMAVTGYQHIHVAVLIGGNDYRQTVVRWDQDLADYILGETIRFRDEHLLPHRPPAADLARAEAYLELDAQLHPNRVGELDIAEIGDVDEYVRLSRAAGEADRAKTAAKARLAELAAGARYVTFENRLAYEFAPRSKPKVDLARLAERHPAAYADCVTQTEFTALQIGKDFKNV
jgi:putative phage-type endonuclease